MGGKERKGKEGKGKEICTNFFENKRHKANISHSSILRITQLNDQQLLIRIEGWVLSFRDIWQYLQIFLLVTTEDECSTDI